MLPFRLHVQYLVYHRNHVLIDTANATVDAMDDITHRDATLQMSLFLV